MNRFASTFPEDWEERQEAMVSGVERQADELRKGEEPSPCPVCGEHMTHRGKTCQRCVISIDEDILRRKAEGF